MEIAYWLAFSYLGLFCLYHVVTGVVSVFFPDFSVRFYESLYHFTPIETKQYFLMLKPWGALSIHAGLVGFVVLADLPRFYPLLVPFMVLLLIRVAYRLLFRAQIAELFKVDRRRNLINVGLILCSVAAFAFLFFIAQRASG